MALASQINAAELKRMLDKQEDFFRLDARNEGEFKQWRIESRHALSSLNLPYFAFIEDEEISVQKVPRGSRVVVLCAKVMWLSSCGTTAMRPPTLRAA